MAAFFKAQSTGNHFILVALAAALLAVPGACVAAHETRAETNASPCDRVFAPRAIQPLTLFEALMISNEVPVEASLYPQKAFRETLKHLVADSEGFTHPTLGDHLKSQLVDLDSQAIEHLVTHINEIGLLLIQSYIQSHPDSIKKEFTPAHQIQTRRMLLARILVLQTRAKALTQAASVELINESAQIVGKEAPEPKSPYSPMVKRVAMALGATALISTAVAFHYARQFLSTQPAVLHEVREAQPRGEIAPHESRPAPDNRETELPPFWMQPQPFLPHNGLTLHPDVHGPCALSGNSGC